MELRIKSHPYSISSWLIYHSIVIFLWWRLFSPNFFWIMLKRCVVCVNRGSYALNLIHALSVVDWFIVIFLCWKLAFPTFFWAILLRRVMCVKHWICVLNRIHALSVVDWFIVILLYWKQQILIFFWDNVLEACHVCNEMECYVSGWLIHIYQSRVLYCVCFCYVSGWLIYMTHSYVLYCVRFWLFHVFDITHSYVWHGGKSCVYAHSNDWSMIVNECLQQMECDKSWIP